MSARVLASALAAATLIGASAQEKTTLPQVLARAAGYVEEFQRRLAGIAAEETYVQEVVPEMGSKARDFPPARTRTLRSDLLLVLPGDARTWVQFRDVFEVDGTPVRDREDRLTALFLDPAASADRVNRIRAESARYNIGQIERTLNVPVLPLTVLTSSVQPRFRFKVDDAAAAADGGGVSGLPATPTFKVSSEVWALRFEERSKPTLVRTPRGKDIASRGRLWIEPSSGRVLMSELIVEGDDVRAQINVSYQSEPLVGLLVPVEMRERYTARSYKAVIHGQATYGRFRQVTFAPIR